VNRSAFWAAPRGCPQKARVAERLAETQRNLMALDEKIGRYRLAQDGATVPVAAEATSRQRRASKTRLRNWPPGSRARRRFRQGSAGAPVAGAVVLIDGRPERARRRIGAADRRSYLECRRSGTLRGWRLRQHGSALCNQANLAMACRRMAVSHLCHTAGHGSCAPLTVAWSALCASPLRPVVDCTPWCASISGVEALGVRQTGAASGPRTDMAAFERLVHALMGVGFPRTS
jgi:hypothetical protein